MSKVRAVVAAGVIVVPTLALAGLWEAGVYIPGFVRARTGALPPITERVSQMALGRTNTSHTATSVRQAAEDSTGGPGDPVANARMRQVMAKINASAGERAEEEQPVVAVKLSFEGQGTENLDPLQKALGVASAEQVRLTEGVKTDELENENSDGLTESLSIASGGMSGGFLPTNESIRSALNPAMAQAMLGVPGGIPGQQPQPPAVSLPLGSDAPFQGDSGLGGGGARRPFAAVPQFDFSDFSNTPFRETAATLPDPDSPPTTLVPVPGAAGAAGLILLAGLRRRRG